MFSAPIYWRIKHLIESTQESSPEIRNRTIEELLKMNIDNDRMSLLISLLDDVDFHIKDEQKLVMLKAEFQNCFVRGSCVALVCNAFESGLRQEMFKQGNKNLESFATNICNILELSGAECVALAYSLTQSSYRVYAADAFRILKTKCPEITSFENVAQIHNDVLTAVAQYVQSSEELSSPAISENFLNIVKAKTTQPSSFGQLGALGLNLNEHGLGGAHSLHNKVSIAQVLGEIGPSCTASADAFRSTLNSIGQKIDEEQLAAIIVTTLMRVVGMTEEQKKKLEMAGAYVPWNLEVVADVLFHECRGLNSVLVAKHLDHPALMIRTESDYQLLSRFFVRVAGCPIPAAGLLSAAWNNRPAQFAVLTLAANSPRNIVEFSQLITAEQLITGDGISTPPNLSWLCLPLYQRFFQLAASGMGTEVMDVLTKAAGNYPEYFLVSLSQVQDTSNSGVRSELLRRLLPLFTGLQGSRPTYLAVMRKLHSVNPDILILLCRIAFKKAKKLWEVASIDSLLSSLGPNIVRRLEEEGTTDELMSYYCVKADKGELNLEEKALQLLDGKPQNARVFATFVKQHVEILRPCSMQQSEAILSFESCAVLLRAAQNFQAVVSLDELRALAAIFTQQQQQQQQQLLQQQQQQQQQRDGGMGGGAAAADLAGVGGVRSFPADAVELNRPPPGPETSEIEALANSYFQKIYTTEQNILDVINLLRQFKGSSEKRDQEIFRCMIHNLFDEYRFYHKYPEKELQVTGRLFGALIYHQLVSSITLGIALRYVLEALRKDPELGESNDKMFRFGRTALDQFRPRLGEWPQYCSHLVQIPHLGRHCPDLYSEAQRALSNPQSTTQQSSMPMMPSMPPTQQQQQQQQQQGMYGQQQQQQQHQIAQQMGQGGGNQSFGQLGLGGGDSNGSASSTNSGGGLGGISQQFGGMNVSGGGSSGDTAGGHGTSNSFGISSFAGMPLSVGGGSQQLQQQQQMPGLASNATISPSLTALSSLHSNQTTPHVSGMAGTSPMLAPLPAPAAAAALAAADTESKSDATGAADSKTGIASVHDDTPSRSSRINEIQRMAKVNCDVLNTTLPLEQVRDQIHFIINNIAKSNFEEKTKEIRSILKPDHFNWFANYLVVKRISTQPNLHPLYLSVLDALDFNALVKLVLDSAYHNVTKLLQSPNITTSSSERSLLRNLGVWLGQMTLANNKPLLQRRINLKELLFWGFETGRLIAICSFVAKVVEGVKDSKVFRPPNPWLMAILGIMRELYEIEDLKLNIKFEVQVLCKNINIKIEDIPRGNELSNCKLPIKDQRNPDFNFKVAPPSSSSASSASPVTTQPTPGSLDAQQQQLLLRSPATAGMAGILPTSSPAAAAGSTSIVGIAAAAAAATPTATTTSGATEQQLQAALSNLAASVVINPSLQYFAGNPTQRRVVAAAVERGIREILQSAVDRSVTIAVTTTKQIISKDFATEANEQTLRDGAHLMACNLAASLALATCKEPLRIAIGNHLRTLLAQSISDQPTIEQIVQVCSNDNVDLGSALIEKATVEKSVRDIDEVLGPAYQARRAARESGQSTPYVDYAALSSTGKYPQELSEALRPRTGGLIQPQLRVYETFQRVRQLAAAAAAAAAAAGAAGGGPSPAAGALADPSAGGAGDSKALPPASTAQQPAGPMLNMAQALEMCQMIYSRIDVALRTLQSHLQGREVTMSMLGSDNEIVILLRDLATIVQRTQQSVRSETAMTFSENIFNRMFESISSPDPLRLEVCVAILEAVREACGGTKAFSPDFISWLGKYAVLVNNDETARKVYRLILILLLRAKLLRCPDLDSYFVAYIDEGRNLFWLELALSFIRQCLMETMGTIYEFSNTFEAVTKMRPSNMMLKKQLQKWMMDIKTLATSQDERKAAAAASDTSATATASGGGSGASAGSSTSRDPPAVRELVTGLLDRWLRVWNNVNDQVFANYLQLMEQYGVLKTEESADKFFRVATEICVEACLRNATPAAAASASADTAPAPPTLNFTVIDGLSKLFQLLVRLADKEATNVNARVNLLNRVLNAAAKAIIDDHEVKKATDQPFDQRPYYRLLSNMSHDLGIPDAKQETNPAMLPILAAYTQVFLILQPSTVPGFAYSWIQLISRRTFMPHLLLIKGQKGWPYLHRLLSAQLLFLQPFLKSGHLNDATCKKLYNGTLRVLLVLLHDFPEFLSDYHLSFCDLIPSSCVQLRNLVLSAFPRSMRLPDPFSRDLQVDVLTDSSQAPHILTDFAAPLASIQSHLDNYMNLKQPAELPNKLPAILSANGVYNQALVTSLVLYVGTVGIQQVQSGKHTQMSTPAMDIYKQMTTTLDPEGRYILFNAMANQLRYPNSHTNFFSFVMLNLFLGADKEYVQEQIARVLLERLIVHRPHPWGLLITFIELIKNPKYGFWRKSFTKSAPEMERVFDSIARSCLGPNYASVQQAQLAEATG